MLAWKPCSLEIQILSQGYIQYLGGILLSVVVGLQRPFFWWYLLHAAPQPFAVDPCYAGPLRHHHSFQPIGWALT